MGSSPRTMPEPLLLLMLLLLLERGHQGRLVTRGYPGLLAVTVPWGADCITLARISGPV